MKKIAFHTLGCKVNQYETQAMRELFINSGYDEVEFDQVADVYLINTCTVTSLSDRKSRQMLRRARRLSPRAVIAVTGCYAQTAPNEVADIDGVNVVIGTDKRTKIVELVESAAHDANSRENGGASIVEVGDIMHNHHFEELSVSSYSERTRAYIKMQEGCEQFCTYCIIPYARGPVRSRPPCDIIDEARRLAAAGFSELVLVGIHIASYGADIGGVSDLAQIIGEIQAIDAVRRIRLSSIEPMTLDAAFIEAVRYADKLCAHFHISLQSGCDQTLQRMNRKYSTAEYAAIAKGLRDVFCDLALTTDIMVGFPGESDDEFLQSLEFASSMEFADIHVFSYSPRRGTPAAAMKQIDPQVKQKRSDMMLRLAEDSKTAFMNKHIGRRMPVLFEQKYNGKDGIYSGKTSNYLDVLCESGVDLIGQICEISIDGIDADVLVGRMVDA